MADKSVHSIQESATFVDYGMFEYAEHFYWLNQCGKP